MISHGQANWGEKIGRTICNWRVKISLTKKENTQGAGGNTEKVYPKSKRNLAFPKHNNII
jgi:hypothetical protein